MAKTADIYFKVDPFCIIEDGFNPDYSLVSESVFSLGNEYMGVRGTFDEGYSGNRLIGNYFNGVYERVKTQGSAYKGIISHTEFMVNSVDFFYTRIYLDDEVLDLNQSNFKEFKRVLNMKNGCLNRSFIWITKAGKELYIEFERFLSMEQAELAGQKISFLPLNFRGEIKVEAGIDFSPIHQMEGKNFWNCKEKRAEKSFLSILGVTHNTNQEIMASCKFDVDAVYEKDYMEHEKMAVKEFGLHLEEGKTKTFTRVARNVVEPNLGEENSLEYENQLSKLQYEQLKKEHMAWWEETWEHSDIVIDGDEKNQQGIRFCIFQMHQTYHGTKAGTNIGAKGLTGEAYGGNAFWDTETYCLPFYLFNNVKAAKNLLEFRYITLEEAKKRAKELDLEGAFYPIATISGRECCHLWQHASLQLQASTAVAYGLYMYDKITEDEEFLFGKGLKMLVEISRMLVTRGDWNGDRTHYGFYGVMGPDEFQMMVNHNCYTNYMGKMTLHYTLSVLERFKNKDIKGYDSFLEEAGLSRGECNQWSIIEEHIYIPYDERTKLYEQQEGFFHLPHVDIGSIPIEDFPLYHHWSYDRIYRNDMIKQPDVLMFMLLFNSRFTLEQLECNYNYYEPKCIHESSLSPSVHSILSSQLKKHEKAYEYFGFATRMDLDNYNRNTNEGLHTTSIAAAWMNIVYGFGGMRADGEGITFQPSIPANWNKYSFRICYKEDVIHVVVTKEKIEITSLHNKGVRIRVYGEEILLTDEKTEISIPKE